MSLEAHVPYYLSVGDPVEKGLGGEVLQYSYKTWLSCFKSTLHCLDLQFVVDGVC